MESIKSKLFTALYNIIEIILFIYCTLGSTPLIQNTDVGVVDNNLSIQGGSIEIPGMATGEQTCQCHFLRRSSSLEAELGQFN
jgi:hypothetical protein